MTRQVDWVDHERRIERATLSDAPADTCDASWLAYLAEVVRNVGGLETRWQPSASLAALLAAGRACEAEHVVVPHASRLGIRREEHVPYLVQLHVPDVDPDLALRIAVEFGALCLEQLVELRHVAVAEVEAALRVVEGVDGHWSTE